MSPKGPCGNLDMKPLHSPGALVPSKLCQINMAIHRSLNRAHYALNKACPLVARVLTKKAPAPAPAPTAVFSPAAAMKKEDRHAVKSDIYHRMTVSIAFDMARRLDCLMDNYSDEPSITDEPARPELGETCPQLEESTKEALNDGASFVIALAFTVKWFDDPSERPDGWSRPCSWENWRSERTSERLAERMLETIEEE